MLAENKESNSLESSANADKSITEHDFESESSSRNISNEKNNQSEINKEPLVDEEESVIPGYFINKDTDIESEFTVKPTQLRRSNRLIEKIKLKWNKKPQKLFNEQAN
ncbi:hypothetical protein AYI69_g7666 [Smittium culicis]|uniref:Uncharacterized protein n=1 Tax=Smittium culicis TaxID=133412 RepID=A0A1R1XQI0_9FUNG|nr:hypothetical protein AYI69_g7666 [Smittium culicis]